MIDSFSVLFSFSGCSIAKNESDSCNSVTQEKIFFHLHDGMVQKTSTKKKASFDGLPTEREPFHLHLKSVQSYGDGAVWLRYTL